MTKYYLTEVEQAIENADQYKRHYFIEFFDEKGSLICGLTRRAERSLLIKGSRISEESSAEHIPGLSCFNISNDEIELLHVSRIVRRLQESNRNKLGDIYPLPLRKLLKMDDPFFNSIKITRKAARTANTVFYSVFNAGNPSRKSPTIYMETLPVLHEE